MKYLSVVDGQKDKKADVDGGATQDALEELDFQTELELQLERLLARTRLAEISAACVHHAACSKEGRATDCTSCSALLERKGSKISCKGTGF